MKNRFYSSFDFEQQVAPKSGDVRTPFQVDRDRIVFSYAFRRLQSKTQVFQSGEFDFYRTRLTHSIEVAKIARSIAHFLNQSSSFLADDFFIDSDLVEATGMAHDLGHPPFGHIGERKLNALMREHGGFEGNAQTLRILTHLFYARKDGHMGMNPTRALVDGILKYKHLYSHLVKTDETGKKHYPSHHFIYDNDSTWLDFAFGNNLQSVIDFCAASDIAQNQFKSLECEIMDWADDTAYSINDIIDSIQAGYLNQAKIENWASEKKLNETQQNLLEELLGAISKERYEAFLNKMIGEFIQATSLEQRENPMSDKTNRYRYCLKIKPEQEIKAKLYKNMAVDLIFRSPQIHRIEYKGGLILEKLFAALKDNYVSENGGSASSKLNLIQNPFGQLIETANSETEAMRVLCDAVAEMTDALAIRTYKQLFDPDYGSILDIV